MICSELPASTNSTQAALLCGKFSICATIRGKRTICSRSYSWPATGSRMRASPSTHHSSGRSVSMKLRVSVSSFCASISALILSRLCAKSGEFSTPGILRRSCPRSKSTFGIDGYLRFVKGFEADAVGVKRFRLVAQELRQATDVEADQSNRHRHVKNGRRFGPQQPAGTDFVAAAVVIHHKDIDRNFGKGEIIGLYAHIDGPGKHCQADMLDASQQCRDEI